MTHQCNGKKVSISTTIRIDFSDLLQAHISVSHKHLDVKLPNAPDEGTNGDSNNITPSWHAAMQDFEPYKCTVCNKGFQKMSKLTAHMKIHRSVKMTILTDLGTLSGNCQEILNYKIGNICQILFKL